MPNIDHIMPGPQVVPILWGHDYVANPALVDRIENMISDLVTGSFMNGLAQYGIKKGRMLTPVIIDDDNPPSTIVYTDTHNQLTDEITKKLKHWIEDRLVPAPSSSSDINQFYLIIPPSETTPQKFNSTDDPVGNGAQGWHNEGKTDPSPPPTYYWAIVKTNDVGSPNNTVEFVDGITPKVSHELVEQFVDRNGSFEEIGDPCDNNFNYHGWTVQLYWSEWDHVCIPGSNPVSMKEFLKATGFDFEHKGLRMLDTFIISIDYIASIMQSHDSPQTAPH